jgi:NAD(P)-dependent dehydrogenase (short-subunit alcohol dehydrogenase family)
MRSYTLSPDWWARQVVGREPQPDEIARPAVFLASANACFVTGQTLHVNGGSYLA